MADKKEIVKQEEFIEIEVTKEVPEKIKVKVIANIKYGEVVHSIGEKIYILASQVKDFEALNLVEKLVFEKEEKEAGE